MPLQIDSRTPFGARVNQRQRDEHVNTDPDGENVVGITGEATIDSTQPPPIVVRPTRIQGF